MNASFASSLQSYQPSGSLNYHSGKWDTYGFASGTLVPQNKGDLYVTRDYVAGDKGFFQSDPYEAAFALRDDSDGNSLYDGLFQ